MNAEKIRYIEATPETVVCSDTGEKLMVKESLQEVMRKAIRPSSCPRRQVYGHWHVSDGPGFGKESTQPISRS